MMPMYFVDSSNVTLLFDFWDVHGPAGMALSVLVVLLLTVLYELLKVGKLWLSDRQLPVQLPVQLPSESLGSDSTLASSPSQTSLAPTEPHRSPVNKWWLHCLQSAVHLIQVVLGYMLMLCVMSYNVWIFLGVILGSVIGYFLSFPLVRPYS
ncbi:putative low affinity copper uptake protein 2 [Arapaima gigas]